MQDSIRYEAHKEACTHTQLDVMVNIFFNTHPGDLHVGLMIESLIGCFKMILHSGIRNM